MYGGGFQPVLTQLSYMYLMIELYSMKLPMTLRAYVKELIFKDIFNNFNRDLKKMFIDTIYIYSAVVIIIGYGHGHQSSNPG